MMKYFAASSLFTLFATSQAAGNLRGGRTQPDSQTQTFRVTVFDDLIRSGNGEFTSVHHIMSIPIVSGVESPESYDIELPEDFLADHLDLISMGELFIEVQGATVEVDIISLAEDAVITVMEERPIARRQLQSGVDERRVAALRVSMEGGATDKRQVVYTKAEIQRQLFDRPDVSLKNQYENCSNGAVRIIPSGVYEVTMPGIFEDYDSPADLRNQALTMLAKQLGVASANDRFDHVIVILPPNETPGFVGNAGVNHWVSTLNNEWSMDVMVYMHEIGHNFGLNHAKLSNGAGDYSSYMSATGWKPNLEGPAKCFNGASNNQLQWYKKINREIELDLSKDPTQMVTLAAFSEAKSTSAPILIDVGPYFLQYNLATGFNAGTELLRNEVTVSWGESSTGMTVVNDKGLVPDGNMFTGTVDGKTLRIAACEKSGNNMKLAITLGTSGSPCDIASEPAPTQPATTTTTKPTTTQPVTTKPATTQPAPTQPATTTTTKPTTTQPVTTKPPPTQPAATTTTQPTTTQPVTTKPVPTQPIPTQPAPTTPAPKDPLPIMPADVCSDLNKKKCKKSPLCSWTGTTCESKNTPSAPAPSAPAPSSPANVCSGLNKKKCKKSAACSWDGTTCEAKDVQPEELPIDSTPEDSTPEVSDKCSGLNKRKCKRSPSCAYSGTTCVDKDIFV
eukprot:scaffold2667_cov237-Amphora_coffeaeformis.AAC.2